MKFIYPLSFFFKPPSGPPLLPYMVCHGLIEYALITNTIITVTITSMSHYISSISLHT